MLDVSREAAAGLRKFRQSGRPAPALRPVHEPRSPSPAGTPEYDGVVSAAADTPEPGTTGLDDAAGFVESLMDTDLYSIGAYFCDRHPDLSLIHI